MLEQAEVQRLVRAQSPFDAERTEQIVAARFETVPRRLAFALERWPELRTQAVLDVGCSYGHCLLHFGPGSTGIDSTEEHVTFCRALGLDAVLADANEPLDLQPASFDWLWVSDVIEHLDAPRLVLRRLAPLLRPGGRLLLFLTVAPEVPLARALVRRFVYRGFDAEAHHYQFTASTARFMVERAGYRVTATVAPGHVPSSLSPRLYLEATVDPAAQALAAEAERRNRASVGRDAG